MVALITLLASSTDRERVLDPSLYIKADGEVLFITIVTQRHHHGHRRS